MKTIFISFILTALTTILSAQIVNIPDANFKAVLLGDLAINSNADTEIQVSEANAFNGILDVSNKNIADVTGIEAFINLAEFRCGNNQITTLDMSNSPNITVLDCGNNLLTSLNVSNNMALTILSLNNNLLTTINLANNTSLVTLSIINNTLSSINLSNNSNIVILYASSNPISSLIINNLSALQQIKLEKSLVSSLDLSNNPNLQGVWLDSNINLTSINLKNGNNTGIFGPTFLGNPNLTCIQVDNAAWATSNWTNKDVIASYSTNCSVSVNEINNNFLGIAIYPNPAKSIVNIIFKEVNLNYYLSIMDITGKMVLKQKITNIINTIDISALSSGYYHILVSNANRVLSTKKLIIAP